MSSTDASAADDREPAGGSSGGTATGESGKSGKDEQPRKGILARFALFLRQVVAELRKVIWPTRSELINYTIVVLIFVVIMAAILAAYDFAFARAVFFVFGE